MKEKEIIKEIIESEANNLKGLERAKRKVMKRYKVLAPSNVKLLQKYHKMTLKERKLLFFSCDKDFSPEREMEIKNILRTRPVRSLSGIVNVSVLTKPYSCPGECIYCPEEKGMPKSYLSNEPAVMRAVMNQYDAQKQVKTRIQSLKITGHPVDKIEIRVVGGTWSFYPKKYRHQFIKDCFDACNNRPGKDLTDSQRINGNSKYRIVGLSIETRPDFITKKEIIELRELGVTSVELGVQSIYDDVLEFVKRGHGINKTIEATKLLKEAGFKVCYQMMPNLPESSLKKDKEMFDRLFKDSNFQPDYLKIYPTATIEGTVLHKLWKEGKYHPYADDELKKLIKDIKKNIPCYVRIQRLVRDIPAQSIEAGSKISNLRQIISQESVQENWQCKCIRCREIKESYDPEEKLTIFRSDYSASGGTEIFLSFEDQKNNNIYSLLRLRINGEDPDIGALKKSAIIREIHTYGQQVGIKSNKDNSPQHKGLGKKLIEKAEEIALNEFDKKKMAVIAAAGTRNYYRKLGYRLKDTYMVKTISAS